MIVLDSDALIEILDRHSQIGELIVEYIRGVGEDVATTSINLHEVLYGLRKFGKTSGELLRLPALNFEKRDAHLSSTLKVEAERAGKAVRRTDAMIAAVARNRNCALLTFDHHFQAFTQRGLKLVSLPKNTSPSD